MDEEKELLVTKLSLIKQYRSVGYIAEVIDVELDIIKNWLEGTIDDDIVDDVNKLLDNEFTTELKISLEEDELFLVKELIKNKIVDIELKHGVQETLKLLGGVSVATLNRYKRGEIPMSNLLYIKSMVEDIKIEDVKVEDKKSSGVGKSLGNKLKTKLSNDEGKKETSINNSDNNVVNLRGKGLSLGNTTKNKDEKIEVIKPVVKEKLNSVQSKEEKVMSEKKDANITKLVFSGVERELKEMLGDSIELKRVEFSEDKLIIEAGIKED